MVAIRQSAAQGLSERGGTFRGGSEGGGKDCGDSCDVYGGVVGRPVWITGPTPDPCTGLRCSGLGGSHSGRRWTGLSLDALRLDLLAVYSVEHIDEPFRRTTKCRTNCDHLVV